MCKKKKNKISKKKQQKKKVIYNNHHIIYGDDKNKEVIRKIRRGCHQIVTLIRRFKCLSNQEIDTIKLEAELKRTYNGTA